MLKPCKHRVPTNDPAMVGCVSTKLIHSGKVPIEICLMCPYCTNKRNNFFEMTNELFSLNKPHYNLIPCCGQNK